MTAVFTLKTWYPGLGVYDSVVSAPRAHKHNAAQYVSIRFNIFYNEKQTDEMNLFCNKYATNLN